MFRVELIFIETERIETNRTLLESTLLSYITNGLLLVNFVVRTWVLRHNILSTSRCTVTNIDFRIDFWRVI